jgi:hypothetical protein
MPMSHYPSGFSHGVSIRGLPVIQNTHGGDTYWVNSNTGADEGNANGTREKPFASLDYAVGRCTANNGDLIVLSENHAETITADSGVDIDVAGVTVVGLGKGLNRPTFTFTTATAADFKIAAADVSVHNILFLMGVASQAMVVEVSGDYAEISHCEFRETASAGSALTAITIGVADGDADYCHIHDCVFRMDEPGVTNVGDAAISIATDVDNVVIENNHIYGDFDLAGVDVPAGGNASDFLIVRGNYIENTATGQHAVQINTGGTMNGGLVAENILIADAGATTIEAHTLTQVDNVIQTQGSGAGSLVCVKTDAILAESETEAFTIAGGPILVTGLIIQVTEAGAEGSTKVLDDISVEGGTSIFADATQELEVDDLAAAVGDMITCLPTGATIAEATADINNHGFSRVLEAGTVDIDGANDENVEGTVYLMYQSLGGTVVAA